MYLAKLRLLYTRACLERCGQRPHIAHVKLQRDALHLLGRWTTCTVDGLQRDTKDLGNGGVDEEIC
jgi:hypothetical protein